MYEIHVYAAKIKGSNNFTCFAEIVYAIQLLVVVKTAIYLTSTLSNVLVFFPFWYYLILIPLYKQNTYSGLCWCVVFVYSFKCSYFQHSGSCWIALYKHVNIVPLCKNCERIYTHIRILTRSMHYTKYGAPSVMLWSSHIHQTWYPRVRSSYCIDNLFFKSFFSKQLPRVYKGCLWHHAQN